MSPSHNSESFLHFDVVNGAIWCMFLACFIDLNSPPGLNKVAVF